MAAYGKICQVIVSNAFKVVSNQLSDIAYDKPLFYIESFFFIILRRYLAHIIASYGDDFCYEQI